MTAAEFFEYLSARSTSRELAHDLLSAWAGVPPCHTAAAPARARGRQR